MHVYMYSAGFRRGARLHSEARNLQWMSRVLDFAADLHCEAHTHAGSTMDNPTCDECHGTTTLNNLTINHDDSEYEKNLTILFTLMKLKLATVLLTKLTHSCRTHHIMKGYTLKVQTYLRPYMKVQTMAFKEHLMELLTTPVVLMMK